MAAVTAALNIKSLDCQTAAEYIAERCRDEGTRGTLRTALDVVLDDLLPYNSAELLNQRPANCIISYCEIYPNLKPQFVSEFSNKEDLTDVLRASCCIPFYL